MMIFPVTNHNLSSMCVFVCLKYQSKAFVKDPSKFAAAAAAAAPAAEAAPEEKKEEKKVEESESEDEDMGFGLFD